MKYVNFKPYKLIIFLVTCGSSNLNSLTHIYKTRPQSLLPVGNNPAYFTDTKFVILSLKNLYEIDNNTSGKSYLRGRLSTVDLLELN
jgi:hypothetical protein